MTVPPISWCARCLLPSTKPDLQFDVQGVCSACTAFDRRAQVDWMRRKAQLAQILDEARQAARRSKVAWDCVVPVSGGKDSWFQTLTVLEHGLRPLLVSFEPSVPTDLGKRNLAGLQALGADLLQIRKDPQVYRRIARAAFKTVGDHEWPNHQAIFARVPQVAVAFKVPLIVWGENSQAEYGGPEEAQRRDQLDRRWLEEFGGLLGMRLDDFVGLEDLGSDDLAPYRYPSAADLEAVGVRGIFLGHYLPWDARRQVELVKACGFEVSPGPVPGTYTDYENLDCATTVWHDSLKYAKYGFGRATDHASLDVRHGRISRQEGLELVRAYDGSAPWGELHVLAGFLEMPEDEVRATLDSFVNPALFAFSEGGRPLADGVGDWIPLFEVR